MARLLSGIDRFLSGITPLLLLLALASGTISYFSNGVIPDVAAITGIMAGFSVEALTWLQVRRCREAWSQYSRTSKDDPQRDMVVRHFRVMAGLLTLLAAFSFFNQLLFLQQSFHPSPGLVPVVWQWVIRAAVLPVLVLVSGIIAPLHEDPSEELSKAAMSILKATLRDTVLQVRTQIAEAKERGDPLMPVAVALLMDAQDLRGARRLRTIAGGLAESRGEVVQPHSAEGPVGQATRKKRRKPVDPDAAEATVRRLLASDPRMRLSEVMRRGRVSMAQAGQLRKRILAEMDEQAPQQAAS